MSVLKIIDKCVNSLHLFLCFAFLKIIFIFSRYLLRSFIVNIHSGLAFTRIYHIFALVVFSLLALAMHCVHQYDFDATGHPLFMYSVFVKYLRKIGIQ